MLGRGPYVLCIDTGKTVLQESTLCSLCPQLFYLHRKMKHSAGLNFFTMEMYIYLIGEKWSNNLQKQYDAAAAGSQGFAFSSSHEYLFNQPASWQTFSAVSLAFSSTFLRLLQ